MESESKARKLLLEKQKDMLLKKYRQAHQDQKTTINHNYAGNLKVDPEVEKLN